MTSCFSSILAGLLLVGARRFAAINGITLAWMFFVPLCARRKILAGSHFVSSNLDSFNKHC
jgi:hypothetical protein